jgi:beta-galactosidase
MFSTTTGDGGVDDLSVSGTGRFVRMNGTQRALTGFGYSLWEFQIYGSPP